MSSAALTMALALVVGLPASLRGRYEMAERSEVLVRSIGLPTDPTVDLTTEPRFRLNLSTHTTDLTLGYSIRYALRAVTLVPTPELMQTAMAGYAWHDRRTRLSLTQDVAFGRQTFIGVSLVGSAPTAAAPGAGAATPGAGAATPGAGAAVGGGAAAPPDMAVRATSLKYVSERTGLTSSVLLGHGWTLDTSLAYAMDGGFDQEAQQALPLRQGPELGVHSQYRLSQRDDLLVALDASRASFSNGFWTATASATAGVRRRLARRTDGEIGAGASEIEAANDRTGQRDTRAFPMARASLGHELALSREETLRMGVTAALAPGVNRLTATVGQRVQGGVTARYARGPFALQMETGVLQSVRTGGSDELRIVHVDGVATYRIAPAVVVELGAREYWQRQAPYGQLSPQKLLYLALTIQPPDKAF